MTKALLVVYSGPASPDREAEYNDWYDNTHLAEVCAVPGFTGARRFALSATQGGTPDPAIPKYLALYDIDAPDLAKTLDELRKAATDGSMHMSDAMALDPPPVTVLYELIEP